MSSLGDAVLLIHAVELIESYKAASRRSLLPADSAAVALGAAQQSH